MIILDQSETTNGTPFSSPTHTLSRPGLNFPKPLITCMLDLYRCIQIQSWKWVGSVCELMMMGVGLGLQFTSLEAWIKMDYGSHLRRYERKGLNMMKHIREKLLHPHHINKKWAQQLRSNWTENKIAHTGALLLPSFLSHHQMNISQFHVDFCSEQNHSEVFVFLPVMSKLSPHQQWLPPARPLTQTSVRF